MGTPEVALVQQMTEASRSLCSHQCHTSQSAVCLFLLEKECNIVEQQIAGAIGCITKSHVLPPFQSQFQSVLRLSDQFLFGPGETNCGHKFLIENVLRLFSDLRHCRNQCNANNSSIALFRLVVAVVRNDKKEKLDDNNNHTFVSLFSDALKIPRTDTIAFPSLCSSRC